VTVGRLPDEPITVRPLSSAPRFQPPSARSHKSVKVARHRFPGLMPADLDNETDRSRFDQSDSANPITHHYTPAHHCRRAEPVWRARSLDLSPPRGRGAGRTAHLPCETAGDSPTTQWTDQLMADACELMSHATRSRYNRVLLATPSVERRRPATGTRPCRRR
jgi:hypothetical protein